MTAPQPPDDHGEPSWQNLLGMGLAAAVMFAAGVVIGWLLDRLLDTSPILVFVGLVAGLCAASWYCVGELRKYLKT